MKLKMTPYCILLTNLYMNTRPHPVKFWNCKDAFLRNIKRGIWLKDYWFAKLKKCEDDSTYNYKNMNFLDNALYKQYKHTTFYFIMEGGSKIKNLSRVHVLLK